MTDKTTTRPATAADVVEFYGPLAFSVRATVLEVNGKAVGIAGYYVAQGVAVVFSESRVELPKITIWREAVKYMRGLNMPAICVASEGSARFLKRLGWRHIDGDIYGFGV